MKPPRVLLVGLDPVRDETFLIARAKELALRFEAGIVLFECVQNQYINSRYFKDRRALSHARQSLVTRHRERLERLARPLMDDGVEVTVDADWDAPADEAVIRAGRRHGADWILIGVGYHPVHQLPFLAGTDWQLIRHASCPLMLVYPREWPSVPRVVSAVDPMHRHGKPEDLDRRILDAGACICRHGGGDLYVFHAFEPIFRAVGGAVLEPLPVEYAEATLEGAHNAAVEALMEGLRETTANVRIAEGKPEEKLPEFAVEIGAHVVVMGAVARNALQRIFIGSTAEKVLDVLACDVLVIKPGGFAGGVTSTSLHAVSGDSPG
jgi:universal stress protein E